MRPAVLVLVLLCAASRVEAQRLPRLDGVVVWDEATPPDAIRDLLADATRVLRDRLRRPRGRSIAAIGEWNRATLAPWLAARRDAIARLDHATSPFAAGAPRERVLGAVVTARLREDMLAALEAVPHPAEIDADPQLLAAYDAQLGTVLTPLLESAASAYAYCAHVEGAPAPLRATIATCAERAAAMEARLAAIRAATPPPPPPRRAVVGADRVPAACTAGAVEGASPELGPIPEGAPLEIAVVLADARMAAAAREQIAAAVHRTLARDRSLRLVSRADVRRAEALVAARRTTEGSLVCAQAPTLARVLAIDHPNLALAYVRTSCAIGPAGCRLDVTFARPLGGDDVTLPAALRGRAPERASGTRAWLAAARALESREPETVGVLGSLSSFGTVGVVDRRVRLGAIADDDRRLRAPETIGARAHELQRCFDAGGTARFDVTISIGEDGTTRDARVAADPSTLLGAASDVEAVRACVERVLRTTAWPCPESGPATIEATLCLGQ